MFLFNVDKKLDDGEALGKEVGSEVGGGSSSSNVAFLFDGIEEGDGVGGYSSSFGGVDECGDVGSSASKVAFSSDGNDGLSDGENDGESLGE